MPYANPDCLELGVGGKLSSPVSDTALVAVIECELIYKHHTMIVTSIPDPVENEGGELGGEPLASLWHDELGVLAALPAVVKG